jgi:hypothetical protein
MADEIWEKINHGDFWEIRCSHPSGIGIQSLGYFRKSDLTPIVNKIIALPDMYDALKALRHTIDSLIQDGTIPLTHPSIVKITMQSNEALWAMNKALVGGKS